MNKTILTLISIIFFSCSNKSTERNNNETKLIQKEQASTLKNDSVDFTFDSFNNIPNVIDGCGCYFYLSKQDEKNERYLFVNDFANVAFVAINGKVEKFEIKKHEDNSNIYFYSNILYDLKVEITKKENRGNETSILEGIIKLSKGNKVVEKVFIGSCGC